jgi:hypothetical protein
MNNLSIVNGYSLTYVNESTGELAYLMTETVFGKAKVFTKNPILILNVAKKNLPPMANIKVYSQSLIDHEGDSPYFDSIEDVDSKNIMISSRDDIEKYDFFWSTPFTDMDSKKIVSPNEMQKDITDQLPDLRKNISDEKSEFEKLFPSTVNRLEIQSGKYKDHKGSFVGVISRNYLESLKEQGKIDDTTKNIVVFLPTLTEEKGESTLLGLSKMACALFSYDEIANN